MGGRRLLLLGQSQGLSPGATYLQEESPQLAGAITFVDSPALSSFLSQLTYYLLDALNKVRSEEEIEERM